MTASQTDFDPTIFPLILECTDCPYDSVVKITHGEAAEAVPPKVEAAPRQAVNYVVLPRGWWHTRGGWVCPQCMGGLE